MHLVSSTPIGAKILQKILAALLIPTLLSLGSCVYPGGLPAGPTPSTAPPAQAATNPTPQLPVTGAVTQITPPPYTSGTHPPPTPPCSGT
ncbi:MAG: hypothetical protein M1281_08185, partial [Chloroflexi bacterium]|nr:hypothetical protein [Chloroflexota bacterium]